MSAIQPSIYEKFIIESADGLKSVDIKEGVISFTYYENLFSPTLTAKAIVVNSSGTVEAEDGKIKSLYNGLPLRGGERVVIKIAGNSKNNKDDSSKKKNEKNQNRKPGQLSPDQIKSILEAMNNQEKNVQKKINAKKVKGSPVKNVKDW